MALLRRVDSSMIMSIEPIWLVLASSKQVQQKKFTKQVPSYLTRSHSQGKFLGASASLERKQLSLIYLQNEKRSNQSRRLPEKSPDGHSAATTTTTKPPTAAASTTRTTLVSFTKTNSATTTTAATAAALRTTSILSTKTNSATTRAAT